VTYQRRVYRTQMGTGRFSSLTLAVGESDLYIGYSGSVEIEALRTSALRKLRRLRQEILDYPDSRLLTSLTPLFQHEEHSSLLDAMLEAAEQANVGPMAAVAGAIAQEMGRYLKEKHGLTEIVVENGGDIFLSLTSPILVRLLASTSPFSDQVGLMVDGTMGVATSSATSGHSLSFGRADAVMVAANDAARCDALATAYCNKVLKAEQAQLLCEQLVAEEGVQGAIITIGDTLAVGGSLEVRRL
jgi:ApbE superfamily uncharacterized protein (UPF0280 family)